MRRISRERFAAVLVGVIYLVVFFGAWRLFGSPAVVAGMATLLTLLLLFGFYCIHRVGRDIRDSARQLQSVFDIRSAIGADVSLPPFGSPAIEADCASVIVRHILRQRPGLIVEAGSGTSTVLAASCLKQIGAGRVVALEHLEQFAEAGRWNLQSQGLAEYGDVRYAPLETQPCDGRTFDWFATSAQQFDRPIDLLFVDGPPSGGTVAPQGRFPALPLLARHLNDEAWIILDDANRRDSRRMLERWRTLFADWGFEERIIPTKRGTGSDPAASTDEWRVMAMQPLSVFVTTFNNASSLAGCLQSAEWADEIVLLDSFSTDSTLDIARRHGCVIHQHRFMGYGRQKQMALELTGHRWVLLLDADEMLSPELQQEIRELMTAGPTADGYWLRRHEQHYWRMASFGVRPDYFLRLFDKTKGRITDKPVHAAPAVSGKTARLRHHFLHFGMPTVHAKVRKINDYSSGLVQDKVARGKPGSPWMMVFYPPFYFLRHYFVERQFVNGWVGFIGAAVNAFYVFLKYAKLYEHYQFERHGSSLLPKGAPPIDRADTRQTT